MSTIAAIKGEIALQPPSNRIREAIQATHYVVVSAEDLRLVLTVGDEPAVSLVLGPADALALASDLLNAARLRSGRPTKETRP